MKWFLAWLVLMLVVSGCVFQPEYDSGVRIYAVGVELGYHPGKAGQHGKHKGLEMATTVIVPASDDSPYMLWSVIPTSPATGYDKIDEGHLTPGYGDYIYETTGVGVGASMNLSTPEARNIGSVSSVRVYLAYYGYLPATRTFVVIEIADAANNVLGGICTEFGDDATIKHGYVDIPVTPFGQATADALKIGIIHATTGLGYDYQALTEYTP